MIIEQAIASFVNRYDLMRDDSARPGHLHFEAGRNATYVPCTCGCDCNDDEPREFFGRDERGGTHYVTRTDDRVIVGPAGTFHKRGGKSCAKYTYWEVTER